MGKGDRLPERRNENAIDRHSCADARGDAVWDCVYGTKPGEGKRVRLGVLAASEAANELFPNVPEDKRNAAYRYLLNKWGIPGYEQLLPEDSKMLDSADRGKLDKYLAENPKPKDRQDLGESGNSAWRAPYANGFGSRDRVRHEERTQLANGVTLIKEGGRMTVEFGFGTAITVDRNVNPPVVAYEKDGSMVEMKQTGTMLSMPPANVYSFENGGKLIAYENGWGSFKFAGDADTGIEYDLDGLRTITNLGKKVVLRNQMRVRPLAPLIPPGQTYEI